MEPTIPTGSVLLSQKTDIDQIELNDIVCYRTRVTEIAGSIVTHRVVSIQTDESGVIYLETRGDANLSSDPYYVDETNLVGRVIWYGGKGSVWNDMLSFLSGKIGFLACIVIPILLIAGGILQGSVRSLRKEMAELRRELYENKKKEELLPGYTTLTYADYEAIYESLRSSLLEELNGTTESNESTGE
jgi:signal peptidase I